MGVNNHSFTLTLNCKKEKGKIFSIYKILHFSFHRFSLVSLEIHMCNKKPHNHTMEWTPFMEI